MGSRRGSTGFTAVRLLPWSLGPAVGIGAFFAIRNGVPWLPSHQSGPIAQGFNQGISAMLASIAWIVLGMCWLAALALFPGSYQRRRLLDTRRTLESLAASGWRQLKLLMDEAFRQGYVAEETGLGGVDARIDLILYKDGRRNVEQCKQWKRKQVSVSAVREMYGLPAHYKADAVKIVCVGTCTKEAERFVQGKLIAFVSGAHLLEMIRAMQSLEIARATPAMRIEPNFSQGLSAAPAQLDLPCLGRSPVERKKWQAGSTFRLYPTKNFSGYQIDIAHNVAESG